MTEPIDTPASDPLSSLVIPLLKGVLYREDAAVPWDRLIDLQGRVRDHVGVLGLDLVVDEAEGYAFLRSRPDSAGEPGTGLPRLVARRPLSFPVSLILALLRKKQAEFDAGGGETRLVLSRDEIVDMVRVFLPETSNEARLLDRIDTHLNRIVDLGFLRRMRTGETGSGAGTFEVKRFLKAFVDAQWLAGFDERLAGYRAALHNGDDARPPGEQRFPTDRS